MGDAEYSDAVPGPPYVPAEDLLEKTRKFVSRYGVSKERFQQIMNDLIGPGPVTQVWTHTLPMMQQSVLLTGVRGPDTLPKYHPSKYLLRWYRRCILLSAMDRRVLNDPMEPNGGSFTGPSVYWITDAKEELSRDFRGSGYLASAGPNGGIHLMPWGIAEGAVLHETWPEAMHDWVTAYIRTLDEVPHHYQLHFMHAAEILAYKHPDELISNWWLEVYMRLASDMHLVIEGEDTLDERLGDDRDAWIRHGDRATEA